MQQESRVAPPHSLTTNSSYLGLLHEKGLNQIAVGKIDIKAELTELHSKLDSILGILADPNRRRESFTVEEVATMLGKAPFTVREWCRNGRINATKRLQKRGGAELWNISAEE